MDIHKILSQAIDDKWRLLPEDMGKAIVSQYGINVPAGKRVTNFEEAQRAASDQGYPLVIKAMVQGLIHKSDRGAVRVGIENETTLIKTIKELSKLFPDAPLLVEQMVKPGVELITGLINDEHFGPCLMIGTGGVFTEVFQDVDFLIIPANQRDFLRVLTGLKGYKLLTGFRGKPSYDIDKVVAALRSFAQFGVEAADYYETVDINPLVVNESGATALDVKVVLKSNFAPATLDSSLPPVDYLNHFFSPESVVIIGASATPNKPGNVLIRNILENGYDGKLYLVNPRGGEILGLPVHPSIESLPDGIDLAIIIIPAKETPQALRMAASKGIKHVVLSAGGFAEVDDYGAQIQQELMNIIQGDKTLHVLGPNTSGHISTPHKFTSSFFPLGKIRQGKVSYIAQTGNFATHTMKYILTGEEFGVSRVFGLGNKIDIEESQALQFLGDDSETNAIVMYLESIKYPRRFLKVASEVTRRKPVVMLKGGSTEAGKQAAVAHTAAMAAEDRLVDGMLRQAGIVRVRDYTHLILAGKALSMAPLPKENRISFLAPSGAMLVVLSDLCARLGLSVPDLGQEALRRLQEISPPYIRMRNPVDIWAAVSLQGIEFAYREGMEAVLKDPNIDAVIPILMLTRETGMPNFDFIVDLKKKYPDKPILVSFSGDKECIDECREFLEPKGIPTFFEVEQPFQALSILVQCAKAMNRPK
jgi:acyl-CoA synthetase (NDP forming)